MIFPIMKSTRLLTALCLVLFVSCAGRSFDSAWNQAEKDYRSGKTSKVTGPWQGTWLSASSGHKGNLRCVVSPAGGTNDEGKYLFRYWATWAGPLQDGFDAEFDIKKMGSQYHVEGELDLGAFGSFRHEGVIQGEHFEANYHSSSGDHGNFTLRRPEG